MSESSDKCPSDAARERLSTKTSKGTSAWLDFCFRPMVGENGHSFVPVRIEKDGRLWGYEHYSSEVTSYAEKFVRNFRMTKQDEEWIDTKGRSERWGQIKDAGLWLIGGLFILWAFSFAVGWIVRGFAGIPSGYDSKPEENNKDG